MRTLAFLVGLALLAGCGETGCECDPLEGYYYDYSAAPPDLPSAVIDTAGAFDIVIERADFKGFLKKAEALFPPVNHILKYPIYWDRHTVPDEPLWWFTVATGARIPYAVTGAGVAYYLDLFRLFREGDFDTAGTPEMSRASLEYHARVDFWQTFTTSTGIYHGVYVVEQTLEYDSFCGGLCGSGFTKRRIVVFSADGQEVLGIIGDGFTSFWVS